MHTYYSYRNDSPLFKLHLQEYTFISNGGLQHEETEFLRMQGANWAFMPLPKICFYLASVK